MSRRIETGQSRPLRAGLVINNPQAVGQAQQPEIARADDFLGRLLKYIPAEIVGLYLAARGMIPHSDAEHHNDSTLWVVALVSWILVPIYLWVATSRNGEKPLLLQVVLATLAFPVWILAVNGPPITSWSWYQDHSYVGSVLLVFVTYVFGLIKPPKGI